MPFLSFLSSSARLSLIEQAILNMPLTAFRIGDVRDLSSDVWDTAVSSDIVL